MPEAVIAAAARTPIGRAGKGSLMDVRPDDLLAFAIEEAVGRVEGLDPSEIVDVMVGCGFPQEKQGMNLARRAALLAGLPKSVPGTTVNRFCASSLQTARMAFHAIKAGEGDVYVAAGVESISQVDGYPKDSEELHPNLVGEGAIANVYIPMGLTAENVAERYDVSRDDMDRFAQRSQERAVAAQASGFFARELTPYPKEDGTVVSADDGPRPSSTFEKLQELQPAFKPDGRVTAGNSCPLNDGAAALVIMSEERAQELGVKPRARIIASAVTGLDPEIMGVGPIDAVRQALDRAGMTIDDIDVMELNEAFAAQVIPVCRELGVDPFGEKLNPHGGAIALGHPYGMTGARIMCTLLNDLDTLDGTIGLETMCVGGGQGMAMIVGTPQLSATRAGIARSGSGGSSSASPSHSRATRSSRPRAMPSSSSSPPGDDESAEEADALALWDGDGAVRLLRHDRARRALLLERALPGHDSDSATRGGGSRGRRRRRAPALAARRRALPLDRRPRTALARVAPKASSAPAARELYATLDVGRHDARARRFPPPQRPPLGARLARHRPEADAGRAGVRRAVLPLEPAPSAGCAASCISRPASPPSSPPGSTRSGSGCGR